MPIVPAAAEAYRILLANLGAGSGCPAWQSLILAAPDVKEGASTVTANLAIAAAEYGTRVVLVDADFRRSVQHVRFGVDNARGLSDVLTSESLPTELPLMATSVPGLRLLPAGPMPSNVPQALGPGRLRAVLDRLRDVADVVLVDVPPLAAFADGALWAAHADGVLLVASAGRTRRDRLARARELLDNVGATVVGVALIGGDGEVTSREY